MKEVIVMLQIRKILVPTDFSDHSKQAVNAALDLAKRYEASLAVVHVFQPLAMALPEGVVVYGPDFYAEVTSKLETSLKEVKQAIENQGFKNVTSKLVNGVPHVELVNMAKEQGIDLIVMGSHGRTGFSHALLGSVAEKVVRKAHCPVLVVKSPVAN